MLISTDPATVDRSDVPGPVDIGFAQDMSVHHSQAIAMVDAASGNPDPTLAGLANGIKTAQLEEIGQMQGFLLLWDQPLLPTGPPMEWMHPPRQGADHAAHEHGEDGSMAMPDLPQIAADGGMPGMATQSQLDNLRHLTGKDQEVLFLQLMLRHHQGGITMADYASTHAQIPQVKSLAARMSFDQQQENQAISQLLLQLGKDPRIPPR